MNTCAICECRSNNLNVNLGPFTQDSRLPLVKRVLDLLVESRFGPDSKIDPLPEFGDAIEPARFVNLDLHPQRFYDEIVSDAPRSAIGASLISTPSKFATLALNMVCLPLTTSKPNLGRGSPTLQITQ